MKILQINKFFYRKGGCEAYLFGVSDLLRQKGHDVLSFSMKDERNEASEQSRYFIDHVDFKSGGLFKKIKNVFHILYSLQAKSRMTSLLRTKRPDIAHAHNIARQLSPSIFSAIKKAGIPIVQTLHDFQLVCPNNKMYTRDASCQRCKRHKYLKCVQYKCEDNSMAKSIVAALELSVHSLFGLYRHVDMFIAPSVFLKDRLVDWGIPERKITVIPNFVYADTILPPRKPGNYVLYFGRVIQEKGMPNLLDTMRYLSGTDVKLKIVGDGDFIPQMRAYIKKYDLQNIELLGYKGGEELSRLIQHARFVLLPSRLEEIYPISLLEAAALGVTAIASNRGGIPEVVINAKTGIIMDTDDAVAWAQKMRGLYENHALCEKLGIAAHQKVLKENNPELHYSRLLAVYESFN